LYTSSYHFLKFPLQVRLDYGGQIDAVYTDFEKAFDKVPHNRLLSKLRSCGINGNIIN